MEIKEIKKIVRIALEEDLPSGDITSELISFNSKQCTAKIIAKQSGIICGTEIVECVFREVSEDCKVVILKKDGTNASADDVIIEITGSPASLLKAERTALNFFSHMSGIATLTKSFVDEVNAVNSECDILDTRKTLPGLRMLEKYAVRIGGGKNHRLNLSDQVLIKENHIMLSNLQVNKFLNSIGDKIPEATIVEVEVENLEQLKEVLGTQIDIVMLDNFKHEDIISAVKVIRGGGSDIKIEVSGGVTINNVGKIAETGVDRISIGGITNSASAFDFSMLIPNE